MFSRKPCILCRDLVTRENERCQRSVSIYKESLETALKRCDELEKALADVRDGTLRAVNLLVQDGHVVASSMFEIEKIKSLSTKKDFLVTGHIELDKFIIDGIVEFQDGDR